MFPRHNTEPDSPNAAVQATVFTHGRFSKTFEDCIVVLDGQASDLPRAATRWCPLLTRLSARCDCPPIIMVDYSNFFVSTQEEIRANKGVLGPISKPVARLLEKLLIHGRIHWITISFGVVVLHRLLQQAHLAQRTGYVSLLEPVVSPAYMARHANQAVFDGPALCIFGTAGDHTAMSPEYLSALQGWFPAMRLQQLDEVTHLGPIKISADNPISCPHLSAAQQLLPIIDHWQRFFNFALLPANNGAESDDELPHVCDVVFVQAKKDADVRIRFQEWATGDVETASRCE